MKNKMILGICLITNVSMFSVKSNKSNEIILGDAKIVTANSNLNNSKSDLLLPTIALIRALAKLTVPEKLVDHAQIGILEGSAENILSNVEIQDEIESKLKIL